MKYLRVFASCLAALLLNSAAWAEIYETTDAEGNTVFTDAPVNAGSDVVDLPQTNIADAPAQVPKEEQHSDSIAIEQAPAEGKETVIIHDADSDVYEERLRRERELERRKAAPPHEVGVSDSQMPNEVLDAEPRHEVGDFPEKTPEGVEGNQDGIEHVRHPVEKGGVRRAVHRR